MFVFKYPCIYIPSSVVQMYTFSVMVLVVCFDRCFDVISILNLLCVYLIMREDNRNISCYSTISFGVQYRLYFYIDTINELEMNVFNLPT